MLFILLFAIVFALDYKIIVDQYSYYSVPEGSCSLLFDFARSGKQTYIYSNGHDCTEFEDQYCFTPKDKDWHNVKSLYCNHLRDYELSRIKNPIIPNIKITFPCSVPNVVPLYVMTNNTFFPDSYDLVTVNSEGFYSYRDLRPRWHSERQPYPSIEGFEGICMENNWKFEKL